ncbi:MAG: pyridoxal 5'-phosphate synthase glutaminase subunit PdxT [Candidatus Diapherotrites archaeon]|nr:pyridoxal 5'-phosphate synthase glutaminase subunit PdxT [Candidatus Diapherotrites archaeon]
MRSVFRSGGIPVRVTDSVSLDCADALIIPGGESTTLRYLLTQEGLKHSLEHRVRKGMPVYGTCAGAIVLAKSIAGEKSFMPLMNISVERNAYGAQLDSFEKDLSVKGFPKPVHAVFIRAPRIHAGVGVEVLAHAGKDVVLAREKNMLVSTFHPELTADLRIHQLFMRLMD